MRYAALLDRDERARTSRIAVGVAVSVALHALLLIAYRGHSAPPAEPQYPVHAVAVWLRPLPPPVMPKAAKPAPPRAEPRENERSAPSRPRRIIAVPPAPAERQQQAIVAEQPEADHPHFDHDGAFKMARKIASESASAGEGPAPDGTYTKDSRLGRGIGAAKRRNCKDGLPGGLLAPLFLMLDKKDSGCKW